MEMQDERFTESHLGESELNEKATCLDIWAIASPLVHAPVSDLRRIKHFRQRIRRHLVAVSQRLLPRESCLGCNGRSTYDR